VGKLRDFVEIKKVVFHISGKLRENLEKTVEN
jgi:hypothetical protein